MRYHVVVVKRRVKVASKAIQAGLQVEDEEQRVVLVQAFERDHCHQVSTLHALRKPCDLPLANPQPRRLAMAKRIVNDACIVTTIVVLSAGDAA